MTTKRDRALDKISPGLAALIRKVLADQAADLAAAGVIHKSYVAVLTASPPPPAPELPERDTFVPMAKAATPPPQPPPPTDDFIPRIPAPAPRAPHTLRKR